MTIIYFTWGWQRSGHPSSWSSGLRIAGNLWPYTVIRLEGRSRDKGFIHWGLRFWYISLLGFRL